ncbi:MAG: nucleotidyltransferase [Chloroflexi bacterium]|nr:nucleotidyltransferase [Chloroflexota bacterium]
MTQTLKIVIPTAGWATRMRPQTWSKPKPLVSVAGRTVLDHLLDMFESIPARMEVEYVFIVGPYLGETQIPPYVRERYPALKAHYVLQPVMKGQSDAFWLAREHLTGPVLICFSDTLMETDFSFLADEKADGVAWVKPVPDPRRFGVAEVDGEGWVTHLVEKPQTMDNNLVVVGCYYFKQAEELLSAIEEQFRRGASLRGEYFLTDTINIMIERGLKMRTQTVEVWLDTGTIDATLETNRYLLEHGKANKIKNEKQKGIKIVPPVFVHASAKISNSVIGPYASIGADCIITGARVEDSILEAGVTVDTAALKGSFIGRQARVQGRSADDPPLKLNIGDNSSVTLK